MRSGSHALGYKRGVVVVRNLPGLLYPRGQAGQISHPLDNPSHSSRRRSGHIAVAKSAVFAGPADLSMHTVGK